MTFGIGAPKFYIYDSTRTTLQSIPANLGSSGCITLSKRVTANDLEPQWNGIVHEDLPITHGSLEEFFGYRYRGNITVSQEDYCDTLLQYTADQATDYVNDIYKLRAIQAYADQGYEIKFTPHADMEDIWNCPYPIWVRTRIVTTGKIISSRSNRFVMQITGADLVETLFPFTAFSFTHLDGIANTNQCISWNGTDEHATIATPFSIGTTHSIEFLTSSDLPADGVIHAVCGTNHGGGLLSYFGFVGTGDLIYYNIQNGANNFAKSASCGSMVAGTKHHWVIARNETSIDFYKDGSLLIATQTLGANSAFTATVVGAGSASINFFAGKFAYLRCYQSAITAAQVKQQYNRGYGNYPLDIPAYFIYEMNGTGGTSTTEDNQEGTASKDLTLVNTPTRGAW